MFQMYKCKPERSVAQTRLIILLGLGIPAVLFPVSGALPAYGSAVRLAAFILICVTIMLMVRYVLSEYEYTADGESFSVTRITGNRRTTVCCLNLASAEKLLPAKEYRALPAAERAVMKYSLCQNIRADSYVFLCDFNGKRTMVEFEPNEAFVKILRDQMDNARRDGGRMSGGEPAPQYMEEHRGQ